MISIRAVAVDAPEARALIRSYLTEMVDRYHGRPMPASAVDEALADGPADDVTVLLVAYRDGVGIGCVGLRRAEERTGEITKMYVSPAATATPRSRRTATAGTPTTGSPRSWPRARMVGWRTRTTRWTGPRAVPT